MLLICLNLIDYYWTKDGHVQYIKMCRINTFMLHLVVCLNNKCPTVVGFFFSAFVKFHGRSEVRASKRSLLVRRTDSSLWGKRWKSCLCQNQLLREQYASVCVCYCTWARCAHMLFALMAVVVYSYGSLEDIFLHTQRCTSSTPPISRAILGSCPLAAGPKDGHAGGGSIFGGFVCQIVSLSDTVVHSNTSQ